MNRNKAFLVLTAVISAFCGSYIFACHSSHFRVSEIRIVGNHKIAPDEITKKAESCLGTSIVRVNLERLEERLREDVRIREVRLRRRWPRCIVVEVEEKRPVLWISLPPKLDKFGSCGFCGLSIDQEAIPLDREDLTNDLPIVSGIEIDPRDRRHGRPPRPYHRWSNLKAKRALEIFRAIRAQDPPSAELLAEINVKDMSSVIIYLLPGVRVMMGQGDFGKKWRRVRTVLGAEEEIRELAWLDLRFDDQVLLARSPKGSHSSSR